MIYINDIIQLEFAWRQFCRGARTYPTFLTFYFSQAVLIFYLKVILMHQRVWCSYKALQVILNLNWHINLISLMSDGHKENKQRNKHVLTHTLSSVFLSAFLSFSSLTACLSASFFSVSSMATALCSARSRSSTAARSV